MYLKELISVICKELLQINENKTIQRWETVNSPQVFCISTEALSAFVQTTVLSRVLFNEQPGNITGPVNNHQLGHASERIWKTEPLQTNCAYVGDIMDVPGTSVAISNCDGLVRLIPFSVYVFAGVWEFSMASV